MGGGHWKTVDSLSKAFSAFLPYSHHENCFSLSHLRTNTMKINELVSINIYEASFRLTNYALQAKSIQLSRLEERVIPPEVSAILL